jgi:hypothetical protein
VISEECLPGGDARGTAGEDACATLTHTGSELGTSPSDKSGDKSPHSKSAQFGDHLFGGDGKAAGGEELFG